MPGFSPMANMPPAQVQPRADAGCVSYLRSCRIRIGDVLGVGPRWDRTLNEEVTVRPDGPISPGVVADQLVYGVMAPELHAVCCSATVARNGASRT